MIDALRALLRPLLPYIGVFVGWLLHEISDRFRQSREDRRLAGKVLTELLELRHHMLALPTTMRELRKFLPEGTLPDEVESILRTVSSPLLAKLMSDFPERYNRAIDAASGAFPLLAFELRSKEKLGAAFADIRTMVATDAQTMALISQLEGRVSEKIVPLLNELALKLARIHGWWTWLQIRRRLRKSEEFPEIREILEPFLKAAQSQTISGQTSTP